MDCDFDTLVWDDLVEAVVLEVGVGFDDNFGIAVSWLEVVIKMESPALTAYEVILVLSSMEDDIMWTTCPCASAIVPGGKMESFDDVWLVIA